MRGSRSSAPTSSAARRSSRRGCGRPWPLAPCRAARTRARCGWRSGKRRCCGPGAGGGAVSSARPAGDGSPAHLPCGEGVASPRPLRSRFFRTAVEDSQRRGEPPTILRSFSVISLILSSDPKNTPTNYSPVPVVLTHGSRAAPGLWRCCLHHGALGDTLVFLEG